MTEETMFAAALEKQNPAERSAFLDEACADDPALRQRVEALLQAHEKAGDFLERPAVEQMAGGAAPALTGAEPGGDQAATTPSASCSRPPGPARWAGWNITRCWRCSAGAASASC